jgi:spore maturation protein CgeB
MKVLLPGTNWQGKLLNHIGDAFNKLGFRTSYLYIDFKKPLFYKLTRLNQIVSINKSFHDRTVFKYNNALINKVKKWNPDLIVTFSGGYIFPETIEYIRNKLKCLTVTFVGDNPFDSSRDKYYAMSLFHYNYIFVHEKVWIKNIKNVTPKSKVYKMICGGGYNPDYFSPIDKNAIIEKDRKKFECEVSFTGSNYGEGAEGAYRAGILNQLAEFDVRIWGYGNWPFRFNYYPNLKKMYKGDSLSWENLRKLYTLCKINLNMPSPQIFTGFQPRLFDIAATKGFQIIDEREELWEYFTEGEIVTFKNIHDLKDKIRYYLNHPKERNQKVEKLYRKVVDNFTWQKQVSKIIDIINE